MSQNATAEVKSPCISICAMNEDTGFCHGCYRSIDEIKAWWDMDAEAKKNLLVTLDDRQLQLVDFAD